MTVTEFERLLVDVRRVVSPISDVSVASAAAIQADAEAIVAEGVALEAEMARARADGTHDPAAVEFLRRIIWLGLRGLQLQVELWFRRTTEQPAPAPPALTRSGDAGGRCRGRRSR